MRNVFVAVCFVVSLTGCQGSQIVAATPKTLSQFSMLRFNGLWTGTAGNAVTSHQVTFLINFHNEGITGYYQQDNGNPVAITKADFVNGELRLTTGIINWTLREKSADVLAGVWRSENQGGPVNVSKVNNMTASE